MSLTWQRPPNDKIILLVYCALAFWVAWNIRSVIAEIDEAISRDEINRLHRAVGRLLEMVKRDE